MKKIFIPLVLSVFVLFSSSTFAQKKPNFIPENGYWQLVSNIKDKKTVTVKFYNEQNEMIYEETLSGKKMNANRTKIRRQLYYALKDAYNQWALYKKINSNDLIAKRK